MPKETKDSNGLVIELTTELCPKNVMQQKKRWGRRKRKRERERECHGFLLAVMYNHRGLEQYHACEDLSPLFNDKTSLEMRT